MAKAYDNWETISDVGEGGQANVYLVQNRTGEPQGRFALKRLRNPARLDRFRNEITAAQKLSHEGVVKIVDLKLDGPRPYLVMPYYEKGNAERAGVPQWPIEKRLGFFRGILAALAHAHEHGVIHRDLKPENILVTDDDTPIVSDFGICFIDGGVRCTTTYEAVGARNYIPPEAESGRLEEIAKTFDVYMLGKVLYWILAGRDLPRERHRTPSFDLIQRFEDPRYEIVNDLLDVMVVEDPSGRLADLAEVTKRFERISRLWPRIVNYPSTRASQRCVYCGIGHYVPIGVEQTDGTTKAFQGDTGITEFSNIRLRVVHCDHCGNVQTFNVGRVSAQKSGKNPWQRPPG